MSPEQWERVQNLFHEALERRPEERAAFLEGIRVSDPTLHAEVLSLLDSHEGEGILDGREKGRDYAREQFERVARALADRYTLESEAGEGGMATVYLARDLKHHRAVAIKVLHPYLAHALGVDRFLAEIETTAGLQHPHILPLFDSGEADGFLFFVMPFVEGESLRERMKRERQLPVQDAVRIGVRMAEALDYAHRRGVVHRDIKPGNVLLQDGQPAISDFGIALALGAARDERLTQPGHGLGTPRYMSPEQVTDEHVVGPPSDIYSLGCVLHEMLVGEPPFDLADAESIRDKVTGGTTTAPRERRRSVPPHVDAAIRRALEPLPADRFRSAGDFATALTDPTFRHGDVGRSDVAGTVRRWKAVAGALAAMLVVALGLAIRNRAPADVAGPVQRFVVTPTQDASMLDTYVGVGLALSPDGERLVYVGGARDGLVEGGAGVGATTAGGTGATAAGTAATAAGTAASAPGTAAAGSPGTGAGLGTGTRQLWQRPLNVLEPVPIAWTDGADNPVFSPDGSSIAFRAGDELKTVSLLGGLPTVLTSEGVTGQYIDWGDDGYIYFASDSIIARIPEAGGDIEPVTTVFAGARSRLPRALPGGRGLLVTLRRDAAAQATVGVVGRGGGAVRELLPGLSARYAPSGHLVYATPGGTLMAAPFDLDRLDVVGESVALMEGLDVRIPGLGAQFALASGGTLVYRTAAVADLHRPVWVDRSGAATPVAPDWTLRADPDDSSVSLSPVGDRLLVSLSRGVGGGWDLWMRSLESGGLDRLTTEGIENRRPHWSRDGSTVTYVSNGTEGAAVHRRRADGTGGVAPVSLGDGTPGHQPSEVLLSSSGEWLVYRAGSTDGGSSPDVFALRIGEDDAATPLLAEPHIEWAPALSPDDRWLAYASDESGRREVYVRPFPDVDRRRVRISVSGGDNPVWAPSGDELFYRDAEDRMIVVPVTLEPDFAVGPQSVLFSAAGYLRGEGHPMYDVTPDGRRFVFLEDISDRGGADLVLVRNWLEELVRRVPRR